LEPHANEPYGEKRGRELFPLLGKKKKGKSDVELMIINVCLQAETILANRITGIRN
jgi:hypothetical protein